MNPTPRRSLMLIATLLGALAACSSPTAPPTASAMHDATISAPAAPAVGARCGVTVGADTHC
jgi:hypothetical protein